MPTDRPGRRTTWPRCSTGSGSNAPTSSVSRWADSRPSISGCATRTAPGRSWSPAAATARRPKPTPSSPPARAPTPTGSRRSGMPAFAPDYSEAEARLTLKRKDPRGFDDYLAQFAAHSTLGSAMHMRHVQGGRPSLWDFAGPLGRAADAGAGGLGRHRRGLPGDRHLPQAHRPRLRPLDRARHRARGQPRGTRRLQPRARTFFAAAEGRSSA